MFIEKKILLYDESIGLYILHTDYAPNKTDKTKKTTSKFEILLETYSNLWPKGVKSGGRLIRKTPNSLRAKLQAFVNKRKDLAYESILQGTEAYLATQKSNGWQYTISSDYFISKSGSSELESWADLAESGDLKSPSADNFVDSLN